MSLVDVCFFFFQAEDGIRDYKVTGVQTCALPIWDSRAGTIHCDRPNVRPPRSSGCGAGPCDHGPAPWPAASRDPWRRKLRGGPVEIGRAACRGRGEISGVAGSLKKKKEREDEHDE